MLIKIGTLLATVPMRVIMLGPQTEAETRILHLKKTQNTFAARVSICNKSHARREMNDFSAKHRQHETRRMCVLTSNVPRYKTIQPHQ